LVLASLDRIWQDGVIMAGTFVDVDALTKNKTCNGTGPPYFDSVMKLASIIAFDRLDLRSSCTE